jgi:hypothetical protein
MMDDQRVSLKLKCYLSPKKPTICRSIIEQEIIFVYDKWTKGHCIAMSIEGIDSYINFDARQLQNIIEFLIKENS